MRIDELDYELPAELIAEHPPTERDGARLLCVERASGALRNQHIVDLPRLLPPSLLVVNDTRVLSARLRGHRSSGGQVELLLVERVDHGAVDAHEQTWLCMGRASKPLRVGTELHFGQGALRGRVIERVEQGRMLVQLTAQQDVLRALDDVGEMPLPPYIRRAVTAADRERYQTVFARVPGAIAAPTAGLHLSVRVMDALRDAGHLFASVTLHVGPGTFAPLKTEELSDHPMHHERYEVPAETVAAIAEAKRQGRPVVAVGTTVVRTLEAASCDGELRAGPGNTALFIYPPYDFRVVDGLLTNFHLPRSTLLALVMAFAGVEPVRAAYAAAVRERYRFFSYGDAMLITPERPCN